VVDAHGAELFAAHGAVALFDVELFTGRHGLFTEAQGPFRVEAEVELVFPAEFKAGFADGVVAVLRVGDSFGEVGGVRGDFVCDDSFADVFFVR